MKILLMALVVAGMVGTLTPTQAQAVEGHVSGERVEDVNSDKEADGWGMRESNN